MYLLTNGRLITRDPEHPYYEKGAVVFDGPSIVAVGEEAALRTAYYLVTNQPAHAGQSGLEALKIAFAIVLGIVFIVAIPREIFHGDYWRRRKQLRLFQKRKRHETEKE